VQLLPGVAKKVDPILYIWLSSIIRVEVSFSSWIKPKKVSPAQSPNPENNRAGSTIQ
jgi:hypothetical protein